MEYGTFCIMINEYLRYKDTPNYESNHPRNNLMNILINKGLKIFSNLYRYINGRSYSITNRGLG